MFKFHCSSHRSDGVMGESIDCLIPFELLEVLRRPWLSIIPDPGSTLGCTVILWRLAMPVVSLFSCP